MSDYLKRLRERAQDSLWDDDGNERFEGAPPEIPQSIHAVKHDSFDELTWRMLLDQIGALKDAVHDLAEDHGTSQEAQEDLFNLLHQTDPLFRDAAEVKPTHRPQRELLERLAGSDEFETLREGTVLDEYGTAFSQLVLQEPLRKAFDEMRDAQEAMAQAQQQLSEAMGQADAAQSGEEQVAAEQALEQALSQVEQTQADASQQAQEQAEGLQEAAQGAADDLTQENDTLKSYGLNDGDLRMMSFEERRALAERINNSRLVKLAKLIGAFRSFADAERRRKIKHVPSETYDVEMGNDLTRLVPSELTNLAVPELEDHFWLRWAKHGLLMQRKRGYEKAGMGPVIVVCDESSSMDKALDKQGNTREAWSKAVSMALADQAKRGKRDFTYIGFSSSGQQWERTFNGGVMSIDDIIEFTSHFFCGGTSYEQPLTRAMQIVEEYARKDKGQADIVLITDDECRVAPSFIDRFSEVRTRTETSLYGLQVGEPKFGTLKTLADRTLNINKLTANPEAVRDLFRSI